MAQFEDKVKSTVIVDGKQGINELGRLEMAATEYRQELKRMKQGTVEYAATSKKLDEVTARLKRQRDVLGLSGMTMRQLRSHARDLRREMDTTAIRGTKKYEELRIKLQQVNAAMRQQRAEVYGMNKTWTNISSSLSMFGPAAMVTTGIFAIIGGITSWQRENIALSDTLRDVQKNTDLTAEGVDSLADSLMRIDTKSTRQELLDIAIIAGKLGIEGEANLLGFVAAADKINVALGEDLGEGTESLRKLGKLVETFKIKDAYGIEDALLKVGSAVNTLGRSSTASEANIVEFTRRMGGIAPQAKVSIQDILGLGGAADALGVTMEVAGTALSQVFSKMAEKRDVYAKFAVDTEGNRMSVEKFTELINTDFNTAFLSVLRGLNGNSEAMTTFIDTLGDMGLEGQRVKQVIGALSGDIEEVTRQQKISNEEFEKGSSILDEFALKNESAGANITKIWKAFGNWFINSSVVRGFEKLTGYLADLVEIPVSETLQDQQYELNRLATALIRNNDNEEIRKSLIDDIQSKYPDFLKSMGLEKASAEDIATELRSVNQAYREKISMQLIAEELEEKLRRRREVSKKLRSAEQEVFDAEEAKRTGKQLSNKQGLLGNTTGAQHDLNITSAKTQKEAIEAELAELDQELISLEMEKAKIDGRLAFLMNYAPSPDDPDPKGVDGDDAQTKYTLFDVEAATKETEAIKGLVDDVLQTHLDAIGEKIGAERGAAAERKKSDEEEVRLSQKKIAAKEQELEMAIQSGIAAVSSAQSFEEAGASVLNVMRAELDAYLSKIVAEAILKTLETSPLPPWLSLPLAAGAGAAFKGLFNKIVPSFYHGGETGHSSIGMGDSYGSFTGYTHGGEMVTPKYVRQDPAVMDAEAVIKARMAGYSLSRSSTAAPTEQNINATLDASTVGKIVAQEVGRVLQEIDINAKISRNTYRDLKEDDERFEKTKSRGKL